MNRIQKIAVSAIVAFGFIGLDSACGGDDDGWVSLFDGKTLSGWTQAGSNGDESKWEVVDGAIVGTGKASMLYSPTGEYKNFPVPGRDQNQRSRQFGNVLPQPDQ